MRSPVRIRKVAALPVVLVLGVALGVTLALGLDASASFAQQQGPVLPPEKEAVAQKIFNELVSPCCWTTTVATHGSGAAPKIQGEVRQMLASGMTHDAIVQSYIKTYGERILAKPKRSGLNLVIYWIPYLALLAGVVVIWFVFRRSRRRGEARLAFRKIERTVERAAATAPVKPAAAPRSEDEYRRRLEDEVRRIS